MDESKRYKWTVKATLLLVSIWSNDQIQSQMRATSRTQAIWNSIGRYMSKRGFPVSGLQCRTRIKNMTGQYQDAVRTGNKSAFEPYFDVFHKVINEKKKAREEKANRTEVSTPTKEEIESEDCNRGYSDIEVLEEEEDDTQDESKEEPSAGSTEEGSYCAVDSTYLEGLINNVSAAQTRMVKQVVAESIKTIERLFKVETEKVLKALAEETHHRKQIEMKLNQLLSRVGPAAVPHLTYMGTDRDIS